MTGTTQSDQASDVQTNLAAIKSDIATLKRDIGALAASAKTGAAEQLSEEARRIVETLTAQGEKSTKAVTQHVTEQPLASVAIAFGVGFVLSRLLSR